MNTPALWTACVTPFNAKGTEIDYPSFERLMRLQAQAGNGIVLCGSTGEGLSLNDRERREIVDFATKLKLTVPIILGVPSHHHNQALEFVNYCNDFPIFGYLMTTPIYTKPGIQGQTAWFEALLKQTQKPVMLYNIPSRSGIKLFPETVANLKHHEHLWAVKDSSGALDHLMEYQNVAPQVSVYCGDDIMLPAMSMEGVKGLISVISNAWPVQTKKYTHMCLEHKPVSPLWRDAIKAMFTASNPIPIKTLMHHLGVIDHPTLRLPLHAGDLPSISALEKAHKVIVELNSTAA